MASPSSAAGRPAPAHPAPAANPSPPSYAQWKSSASNRAFVSSIKRRVRAEAEARGVGEPSPEDFRKAYQAGFASYLVKKGFASSAAASSSSSSSSSNSEARYAITKDEIMALAVIGFPGQIHVVESESRVEWAIGLFAGETMLGMDTEAKPNFAKGENNPTALIQLASLRHSVVFCLGRLGGPGGIPVQLRNLLKDPSVWKIGQGISADAVTLAKEFGVVSAGLVDLEPLSNACRVKRGSTNLRALTAIFLGARLTKSQQMSDWSRRPLTQPQVQYAGKDSYVGLGIFLEMRRRHGSDGQEWDDALVESIKEVDDRGRVKVSGSKTARAAPSGGAAGGVAGAAAGGAAGGAAGVVKGSAGGKNQGRTELGSAAGGSIVLEPLPPGLANEAPDDPRLLDGQLAFFYPNRLELSEIEVLGQPGGSVLVAVTNDAGTAASERRHMIDASFLRELSGTPSVIVGRDREAEARFQALITPADPPCTMVQGTKTSKPLRVLGMLRGGLRVRIGGVDGAHLLDRCLVVQNLPVPMHVSIKRILAVDARLACDAAGLSFAMGRGGRRLAVEADNVAESYRGHAFWHVEEVSLPF